MIAKDEEVDPGADRFPGEPPVPLSRADMVLVKRAVRGRWPIPEVFRRRLMARLGSVIASDLTSSRTVISAGKLMAQLDGLCMEQEKREADAGPADPEARPRIVIPGAHDGPRP